MKQNWKKILAVVLAIAGIIAGTYLGIEKITVDKAGSVEIIETPDTVVTDSTDEHPAGT